MNKELEQSVYEAFVYRYKISPIMINSPGRINLIGEHTDYNLGFVFPAAIDKGIIAALGKSDKDSCSVTALDMDETFEFYLDKLQPIENGKWRNYVIGVVAEIFKLKKALRPFNLAFSGDIPKGAGLSSSAALENSVVFGLNELFDLGLTAFEMIHISQRAEHNFVGVKCGIMDQYASMFGKENSALLIDCQSLEATVVPIELDDYEFVLINSNVSHNLVDAEYNDRREVCEKVATLMGFDSLREANEDDLKSVKSKLSEEEFQKALYVLQENERVMKAYNALKRGNLIVFGSLLFEAHQGASTQFKISCKELDFLVDVAKAHPHVIGSRMMGGGFGGCTINLVESKFAQDFISQAKRDYLEQFDKSCSIYKVQLSKGTHKLNDDEN